MKRLLVLCLLTGPALTGVGTAHAQPSDLPQHRLLVSSHGVSAAAHVFAFCRAITQPVGRGFCADGPPTATSSVRAHGSGAVLLVTGVRVDAIAGHVTRPGGSPHVPLRIVPADTSGRRFIAVLPSGPPLPLLLVFIRHSGVAGAGGSTESGDAAFSIGLREHRHKRAVPKRLTARVRARCVRRPGGRRSCRLYQRGRIEPPAGSAPDCRGGRVLVRLIAGRRTALRARARTSSDCRYRLRSRRFSLPGGARRVVVRTRFLGSSSLTRSEALSVRVRLTLR